MSDQVTRDNFEEVLLNDDLFVDYFNAFLNAPVFPQRVCFNRDRNQFENQTSEPQRIHNEILSLLRRIKKQPGIFKTAQDHSFKPISLMPMEKQKPKPLPKLQVTYPATILHREQGIDWVKNHRLPLFLRSELYAQYRLSKLIVRTSDGEQVSYAERSEIVEQTAPRVEEERSNQEMVEVKNTLKKYHIDVTEMNPTQMRTLCLNLKANEKRIASMPRISRKVCPRETSEPRAVDDLKEFGTEAVLAPDAHQPIENVIFLKTAPEQEQFADDRPFKVASPTDSSHCELDKNVRVENPERETVRQSMVVEMAEKRRVTQILSSRRSTKRSLPLTLTSFNMNVNAETEEERNDRLRNDQLDEILSKETATTKHKLLSCGQCFYDPVVDDPSEKFDELCHVCKEAVLSLGSTKFAMDHFRLFLDRYPQGVRLLELALEVEKCCLFRDGSTGEQKVKETIENIRERFLRAGGECLLGDSLRKELGLDTSRPWKFETLLKAQEKAVETLVSYWLPRYVTLVKKDPTKIAPTTALNSSIEDAKRVTPIEERASSGTDHIDLPTKKPPIPQRRSMLISSLTTPGEAAGVTLKKPGLNRVKSAKLPSSSDITKNKEDARARSQSAAPRLESSFSLPTSRPKLVKTCKAFDKRLDTNALRQILDTEALSGNYLKSYIESTSRTNKQGLLNCLHCWAAIMDFRSFVEQNSTEALVMRKFRILYGKFISPDAPQELHDLPTSLRNELGSQMNATLTPDVFQSIEDFVIKSLREVIVWARDEDMDLYDEGVEWVYETRSYQSRNPDIVLLERKGILQRNEIAPDQQLRGFDGARFEEDSLWESIPDQFRSWTFRNLLENRSELEYFRVILEKEQAAIDLQCWLDVESLRRLPPGQSDVFYVRAKAARVKYLNRKYFFGPNSPADTNEQKAVMQAGGGWAKLLQEVPPLIVFLEMQKHVETRLSRKWLPRFLAQTEFQARQQPPVVLDDVAGDLLLVRHKRQVELQYLLNEDRWASSWADTLALRRALLNPITRKQLRQYAEAKRQRYKQDLDFWVEVQKYKQVYKSSSGDNKEADQHYRSLVNSYINSVIPPKLQIDITEDQADEILSGKDAGVVVFRDAELTVFRVLMGLWAGFCKFRENVAEEKARQLSSVKSNKLETC